MDTVCTMICHFEPTALERRLRELPPVARIAFGVLTLERALPDFFRFQVETEAPGGDVMRGALAKVWGLLEGAEAAGAFAGITVGATALGVARPVLRTPVRVFPSTEPSALVRVGPTGTPCMRTADMSG